MPITDFHTHAFADRIYERAMDGLRAASNIPSYHDGSVRGLTASMDAAGVGRSVVLSIATKPEQVDVILAWSLAIASDRLVPFASVMPQHAAAAADVDRIAAAGIRGLKMHPYYQNFFIDDPVLDPFYEAVCRNELVLVTHAGYDSAYPDRQPQATPERTARVLGRFPRLKLVAAHYGAWEDWDAVERHLVGKELWLETSFLCEVCGPVRARQLLLAHDPERILFGSDSPWLDQGREIGHLRALDVPEALLENILVKNAERLLA